MNERLAARFHHFALHECRGYSPLYETLALGIAEDPDLLKIASHARDGQPPPNMIFAAVQSLLLEGERTELAEVYRTATIESTPPEGAFSLFRSFALDNRDTLVAILAERRVQTNEVGRCAVLYPVFAHLAERINHQPLALIEIGTSAGLNLNWDLYRYRYDGTGEYGVDGSSVVVSSEVHGRQKPPLPSTPPAVASKVGVDFNPLDLSVPEDAFWLRSLVWPEHTERAERLAGAIELTRKNPPHLVQGNGVDLLAELIEEIPSDNMPTIFHTFALYQFPEDQARLADALHQLSRQRDIALISMEQRRPESEADLSIFKAGEPITERLATCHPHGKWVAWEKE